jgi:glycosyltransferase involved in cell wall biosynthesis
MKVLQLCLSPDLGGLELYMLRSARALRARGHSVVGAIAPHGRLAAYFVEEGFDVVQPRPALRIAPLLAAWRLARFIDREGIDLIHMHWGKDLPLAALAKRLSTRRPALVYTRQMSITRPKRDRWHRFQYAQVDRLLAITERLARDLRDFLPAPAAERITTLYYGVGEPEAVDDATRGRVRAELGVGPETFLVGLFGRIKHYKGQHLLVEALARANVDGVAMAGLIVGRSMEEGYLAALKRRATDEALPVQFRDFVREPQRLMAACDCVVLTTVEETFGLVLAEAMRAGVAVVGSDRGGVPEIIDHERTGLLFRSTDGEDLYRQLRRLAEDRSLCARLAVAGREEARREFDEGRHFDRLEAALQDEVSRRCG